MPKKSLLGLPFVVACAGAPPPSPPPPAPVVPEKTLSEVGVNVDWMDTSVSPCQDFFAYACGGFVKTAEIPGDQPTWGPAEELTRRSETFLRDVLERSAKDPGEDPVKKKIGDYFASCMDEAAVEAAGLSPLKDLFGVIGRVKDAKTLGAAITELHKRTLFAVFDLTSAQDFKDATKVVGALDQSGLGLPDRDYYLKDEGNMKEVREFYKGHVGRMFGLAASALGWKEAEVKAATDDVLSVETALAKLQQDKVVRRDPYAIYHRVERAGLTKAAPKFPWNDYFAGVGQASLQEITVNEPKYFQGVNGLLSSIKPAAWKHYLVWQTLHLSANDLSKAFVDEHFTLRQKITGQKELPPRWKTCTRNVDEALGELLAQAFVAEKFAGDSKALAETTVGMIREAFRAELDGLPWMDAETKKAAVEKLDKMNGKIGYPDKWRSYDFAVSRTDYAANVMAANAFELQRLLAKIGKPVDRTEWGMTPPTVNAYYDATMNEMVLPAGILQPPFFSRDFITSVNLGETGASTVGHELTHGFDDEGSQFDGNGNLRDWWSPSTKEKFKAATKCVVDQYSQYEAVPGVKLNGELTAGENIADIGGVKLGYQALQALRAKNGGKVEKVQGMTDDQMFFIGYAQSWCSKETPQYLETMARTNPHSPPKWRVNGPMVNVAGFSQAFSCAVGTPMNPGTACSIW